jgi:hypothetical protein
MIGPLSEKNVPVYVLTNYTMLFQNLEHSLFYQDTVWRNFELILLNYSWGLMKPVTKIRLP